ncbi:sigma-70 family RNA polymerase sigma factor [Neobacillus drentensis]|uniref:sigma-70 family RNA polymerase sigma factor n=1 Tax=Neobacillus drentensis TaxID=220684 RepID=UPI00300049F0
MTFSANDGILNEKLFISLFETHKDSIYRMAYMYMKNQADSLDIVQEVAYRAFKNRNSLKELNYFKTWILKITINASIDFLRKKQKVVELPFTRELGIQQTEDKYSDLLLNELLNALDEDEKKLIYLKYYQEYTFQEISEIVDSPISTVKSKIYRTLEKIRLDYPKEELS